MHNFQFVCVMIFLATSCASSTRILSDTERQELGINGIAYDLRLCPTVYDEMSKTSRESGNCELVDCVEVEKKIVCRARAEKKNNRKF